MRFYLLGKMSRVAVLTLLGAGGCAGRGWAPPWSQANPETMITIDPFKKTITLYNSKDVSVAMGKFSGTYNGAEWSVEGLKFLDRASTVRQANVKQMAAAVELTRLLAETVESLVQRLGTPVAALGPPTAPTMSPGR